MAGKSVMSSQREGYQVGILQDVKRADITGSHFAC